MITYPNCKINLGLHVVGKRPDGYHDLETIFLPVDSLHDELEILPTAHCPLPTIIQEGILLDNNPEDNLCMKAWRLLHEEFDIPTVSIRLKKGIPFGAGLGGGSSDAAFTLKMLNEMFSLGLTDSQLEQRAARLGADCAFFIKNKPSYATGIGDQLEPIECKVETKRDAGGIPGKGGEEAKWKVIVEIPENEHVSTKEAYAGLSPFTSHLSPRIDLRESVKRPIEEWRNLIVNDFEASVFPAHPAIAALKEEMYRRGALYASMTGSGAAVFGIFPR